MLDSIKAREILEKKIEQGRASASALLEKINTEVPADAVVRGQALGFQANGSLSMRLGEGEILGIHEHAMSQLASRAGVPAAYLADLASEDDWKRELARDILLRHYGHGAPLEQYLVREVKGEVRGFLSSRYRRLDSRPLVEALATECAAVGAVPVDGIVSDTRVALRALVPTVVEPVPGECMAFGLEWHNSDFGNGTHSIRAFMLRLVCLNGMTRENVLSQVHIGRRLSEDFEMSDRTYRLDTIASVSALRDVVRGVLAPAKIQEQCEIIKKAQAQEIDWRQVSAKVGKRLLKGELEATKAAFEGPDVLNLPAGKTVWRAGQALSWIAGQAKSPDRRLDLERLAGEIVDGRKEREEVSA